MLYWGGELASSRSRAGLVFLPSVIVAFAYGVYSQAQMLRHRKEAAEYPPAPFWIAALFIANLDEEGRIFQVKAIVAFAISILSMTAVWLL